VYPEAICAVLFCQGRKSSFSYKICNPGPELYQLRPGEPHPRLGPRAKIERAKEHLVEFDREVNAFIASEQFWARLPANGPFLQALEAIRTR
jgi:hypothetical protein